MGQATGREGTSRRASALTTVIGDRTIRRLLLAWALSLTAELAIFVALSVYVYQAAGASALGVLGVARMLPGALLSPVVTGLADRLPRERLLLATTAPRILLVAGLVVTVATNAPVWTTVVLAGLSAGLAGQFRPLQAAMMPWLTRTPAELAMVNGVFGTAEGVGVLAGPAIAGGLLVVGEVRDVVAVGMVMTMLCGALLLGVRPLAGAIPSAQGRPRILRDWLAGMRALLGQRDAVPVLAPMLCQTFARGVLNVLMVPIAVVLFDLGPSGVGWLGTAMGVGGLLGAPVALAVVRSHRLGWLTAVAVILWGLPFVVLAGVHAPVAPYLLLGVVGMANILEDMSGYTTLQRVLPPAVLGRAMGAFEVLILSTAALGSALAPAFLDLIGTRPTLLATGLLLVGVSALCLRRLVRLSRRIAVPAAETGLLRGLSFVDALPIGIVEHLAGALGEARFETGATVVAQGDAAECFYLITDGEAIAAVDGRQVRRMHPGDHFGEIALLRAVPRTATVTAARPLTLRTLGRAEFLAAVTGNADSFAVLDEVVASRMGDGRYR